MKRLAIVLVLAMAVMLAACGGGQETPTDSPAPTSAAQAPSQEQPAATTESAASTNTPAPATATSKPSPTDTPESAATDAPEADEDDDSVAQLSKLEALDSYRAQMVFHSEGLQADGTEVNDTVTIDTAYSAADDARAMTMQIESLDTDEFGTEGIEFYQIGQDMYMYGGEETGWIRVSGEQSPFADPGMGFLTESSTIFTDLEGLDRKRPDQEIAGIDSRHYTFDEKAIAEFLGLGEDEEVKAEGEVWIAKDGGFITKYILEMTVEAGGAGELDATLDSGTIQMNFELVEANEDVEIELPEEAVSGTAMAGFGGEDFPMPEGASVVASTAQFAIVQTDLTVEEAQQFYESALQELGWTKDESGSSSFGEMSSLAFTKEGATLTVLIQTDASTNLTQIMLNAEESQ